MAERYFPFDSVTGDRIHGSVHVARALASLIADGVVAGQGDELQVVESAPAAMTVDVSIGSAFVQGRFYDLYSEAETLTVPPAHSTQPRLDRVVVRRSLTNRECTVEYLAGTPDPAPVAPALTQDDEDDWEIALATVSVPASASEVEDADITDEREIIRGFADSLVLPPWESDTEPGGPFAQNQIAWERESDGSVVARVYGIYDASETRALLLRAADLADEDDNRAQLQLRADPTTPTAAGIPFDVRHDGNDFLGTIMDGAGASSFLQLEGAAANMRLEIVEATVNFPNTAAGGASHIDITIPGLAVGDLCFFKGASGLDGRAFPARTRPLCATPDSIVLDFINASQVTANPDPTTGYFEVIHVG